MTRTLKIALAVATMSVATSPTGVTAQTYDNLSSSMAAQCLFTDCSRVQFTLSVPGSVYVNNLTMRSADPSQWLFNGLVGVYHYYGFDWTSQWNQPGVLSSDQLTLDMSATGGPAYQREVMRWVIDMTPVAPGLQVADMYNAITYTASGTYDGNTPAGHGTTHQWQSSGTVTPEPSTWLLLGSGMLGLGIVARRRLQLQDEFEA